MREQTLRTIRRSLYVGLKICAVAGVLAAVAAISAYLSVRRSVSGGNVRVPDVVGLSSDEAERLLREQGLSIETAAKRHDPQVEAGHVLAQEPAPGSGIKVDRKVKVVVSLGQEGAAVPDLRGGAARMAQIALQQQGYRVAGQVYAHAGRAEENLVLAQDPPPGDPGALEGKVALLISRGRRPPVYVMPDFAGRTVEEASRVLARAGLRMAPPRRERSPAAAAGTVLRQRPESGYPVQPGDLITLVVAESSGGDDQ
jgi:eukaryotic-like serine/threonine-protein kinase